MAIILSLLAIVFTLTYYFVIPSWRQRPKPKVTHTHYVYRLPKTKEGFAETEEEQEKGDVHAEVADIVLEADNDPNLSEEEKKAVKGFASEASKVMTDLDSFDSLLKNGNEKPSEYSSIEAIEYLLDSKYAGAKDMFAVTEDTDDFQVEPMKTLEKEIIEETTALLEPIGGTYREVPGTPGYTWFIKKKEAEG